MALDLNKIPFGLSNIMIGDGVTALNFNGVDEFQAEGGEVSLAPILEDIVVEDFGTGVYDQRIVGYTGSVTIQAAQESIKVLEMALAGASTITDAVSSEVVGITDSAIGTSLRAKGLPVKIHPRNRQTADTELDINIYKMAATGEYTRTTGNSQGSITITLTMFPRDGMDPSKPGNFYYIGGKDPNAA